MTDKTKWPQWLLDAKTENASVEIDGFGRVIWLGGIWRGGIWSGGVWSGGVWSGGEWRGIEDRLLLMSSIIGIVFDADGWATAYRSTNSGGGGRYTNAFVQKSGRIEIPDAKPAGSGTCCEGLHVSTIACAWTYFGVDPTAQLWRVRFRREDLLDCDGEKARIKGGECEAIDWPFIKKVE